MNIANSLEKIRAARAALGDSVGVVLTMGALHDGHLALVRAAQTDHRHVIATLFVNPTQFAQGEDFNQYPRPLERDLELLRGEGVAVVFTPTPEMMYPTDFQTYVTVEDVSQGLEGEIRPGHFRGVATVVNKLFNLTQPTTAYFGQKDAQQVVVIRRMVRDLNMPLDIAVIPTLREADGLAMSSRNIYLTADQRGKARALHDALEAAGAAYDAGEREPQALRSVALAVLKASGGEVEYVSVSDPRTLATVEAARETPLLLSLVVRYGSTRLLDNCLLPRTLNTKTGLSIWLGGA
jgi:pantoate--beta-alanine ligase